MCDLRRHLRCTVGDWWEGPRVPACNIEKCSRLSAILISIPGSLVRPPDIFASFRTESVFSPGWRKKAFQCFPDLAIFHILFHFQSYSLPLISSPLSWEKYAIREGLLTTTLFSIQDLDGSKAGRKNNPPELCSGDFYARINHITF